MPVIVLEARDFASPLFVVRTLEILCSCAAFSLVASLGPGELSPHPCVLTFRIFCTFTWCFFFSLTFLIHVLSTIQFHSLLPFSWKNLTTTVAALGALMGLSSSVLFSSIVLPHQDPGARSVAAALLSCLAVMAYASESYMLCAQPQEQRGYMGSVPGLLKVLQLWGGCQMIPLVVELVCDARSGIQRWQFWTSGVSYGVCLLLSCVTLVVILGDLAGRCCLPFDRFLAAFSLVGVLLYMLATVICLTKILQLRGQPDVLLQSTLTIMETVVSSVTLLAYTVDLAFSIKMLCDRSHM
ncbi:myeloid-associated differentiation marker-like [Menidia menidia]